MFQNPVCGVVKAGTGSAQIASWRTFIKCLLYIGGRQAFYARMGSFFPERLRRVPSTVYPPYQIKKVANSDMGLDVFALCNIKI